ncbi:unnamed protein product [Rangifer tarandus platyrhynchus]|uniref:Uncharacterized protein n=1 Tax=Rangifer tarandus platyrhynchus TaxID=3082113 RepID=A0ABN8XJU2_RANTA|nr:unnamed protein product [Rangifer tarandus platyrhynchus]
MNPRRYQTFVCGRRKQIFRRTDILLDCDPRRKDTFNPRGQAIAAPVSAASRRCSSTVVAAQIQAAIADLNSIQEADATTTHAAPRQHQLTGLNLSLTIRNAVEQGEYKLLSAAEGDSSERVCATVEEERFNCPGVETGCRRRRPQAARSMDPAVKQSVLASDQFRPRKVLLNRRLRLRSSDKNTRPRKGWLDFRSLKTRTGGAVERVLQSEAAATCWAFTDVNGGIQSEQGVAANVWS